LFNTLLILSKINFCESSEIFNLPAWTHSSYKFFNFEIVKSFSLSSFF
jgi:hypothetical protein